MNERFRLDLLVGRRVYDAENRKLGRVDEIRLVREGDQYVVEGLLIGVNGLAERLGVARPLKLLERRLNPRSWRVENHIIDWEQVASIEERRVRLKVRREEVRTVRAGG
jgi:sporulation protein YlmC with PRC-barrel domain